MKRGHMIVTEQHWRIYGTSRYDVRWTVTRCFPADGTVRRQVNYSAEAVRRIIEKWKWTVRFRVTKER